MKFVVFIPRYHSNFHPYVAALKERGHDVSLYVIRGFDIENYSELKPIIVPPIKCQESNRGDKNVGTYAFSPRFRFLVRELRKESPDVVIFRGGHRFYLKLFMAMRIARVRSLIYYNQSPILIKSNKKSFIKRVARLMNSFFVCRVRMSPVNYQTPRDESLVENRLIFKHSVYIPFIQKDFIKTKKYFKDDVLNIICVAKFMSFKNHQVLINALGLLKRQTHKPFRLTLIGTCGGEEQTNYFNDMMNLAKQNDVYDLTDIHLNLHHTEVMGMYHNNDVFILPSRKEVASVSVLEAMAHGLCVLSTIHNGTAHYVVDAEAGYVFDPFNPEELADLIYELIKNPKRIKQLGQNALNAVRRNHSQQAFYQILSDILKNNFGITEF